MRRAPVSGVDLRVYGAAILILLRNPTITVVPLLMAVIGVLLSLLLAPSSGGALGNLTYGLAGLILVLLKMFGLGAACIIADDAWRHGRASFDRGWEETRRRGGDLVMAAIGFTLLLGVAQYAGLLFGLLGLVLAALVVYALVWALPAAAIGGVPGGASIQVSIDRVRAKPLLAGITTAVCLVVLYLVALRLPVEIERVVLPYAPTLLVGTLTQALCEAVALGYVAAVLAKTYSDASFSGSRR